MTQIINWPYPIYSGEVGLNLVSQSRAATGSIAGFRQVVGGGAQRWSFTMDFNTLRPEWIPVYRAALAKGRGRIGVWRIPVRDRYAPKPGPEGLPGVTRVFHNNGSPFGSGAGYRSLGPPALISVEAGKTRATAPAILREYLYAGMYFGLGDDLHICLGYEGDDIKFEPSARRTHKNQNITLRPSLIARLAEDTAGDITLSMGRWGRPQIDFIEHVLR
jgi:hypothetical protein